ncbi:DUF1326 domain-containing protein [Marinobacter sp.]|uniref:DUF1326 domain-containing protein n=1 Tax=Marinobacter sp. TaxID=50741 RepID=UPI00384C189B
MSNEWSMRGEYLESCNCRGACPCIYLGDPTEGECMALLGWHITEGLYGEVDLSDRNVALALHSPGPMPEGNWKVVLYVDQRADERQNEALSTIFGGQAGGHPATLASFIGEVLGVESLPIVFEMEQGRRHLKLGQSAGTEITALEGQEGAEVTIRNHPLAVAPGETLVVARSQSLLHQSHGINLDLSERTAFYSPFAYSGS